MRYIFFAICNLLLLSTYGQNKTSLKKLLLGGWISEDDNKYQLVFKDTVQKEFYGSKLQSTFRYWIKSDSLVKKDVNSGDVFNYAIMGLTERHLTLIYLERGNLLKFRKQAAASTRLEK